MDGAEKERVGRDGHRVVSPTARQTLVALHCWGFLSLDACVDVYSVQKNSRNRKLRDARPTSGGGSGSGNVASLDDMISDVSLSVSQLVASRAGSVLCCTVAKCPLILTGRFMFTKCEDPRQEACHRLRRDG